MSESQIMCDQTSNRSFYEKLRLFIRLHFQESVEFLQLFSDWVQVRCTSNTSKARLERSLSDSAVQLKLQERKQKGITDITAYVWVKYSTRLAADWDCLA